jgi:predicted regulator of Ras-like GTPase activity (Roadblock/LC7/MglB family)
VTGFDVVRVLDALGRVLPPGASASWLAAGGDAGPAGVAAPAPRVATLLTAVAATLGQAGPELTGDGSSVLLEGPGRTVLAHRCGDAGTLVVEAGADLNLALVRRVVRAAVGPSGDAPADEPAAPALPRRRRPPPVAEFRYEPEDLGVLEQLQQALSG